MSYEGKLFGEILYEVRIDDTPYYLEEDIEAMLGLHYGSVSGMTPIWFNFDTVKN